MATASAKLLSKKPLSVRFVMWHMALQEEAHHAARDAGLPEAIAYYKSLKETNRRGSIAKSHWDLTTALDEAVKSQRYDWDLLEKVRFELYVKEDRVEDDLKLPPALIERWAAYSDCPPGLHAEVLSALGT